MLLASIVPVATAQSDANSQPVDASQKQSASWELETSEASEIEIDRVTEVAADTELKVVSPDTALKAVNPDETTLKAVNPDETALKAVSSEPTAAVNNNNELIVIQNIAAQGARASLNIDPQLRADLDAQYNRVQKNKETADAFSESLGEDYLSYGLLLKRAGRLDEASDVLVDAAHISKINNGLNAVEQRPYLAALFDIHMLQDNTEDADKALQRIIWLERG